MTNTEPGILAQLVQTAPSWGAGLEALLLEHSGRIVRSLVILALALVVGRVASRLLIALLARWASRTATEVDDVVLKHLARPARLLFPLLALALVLPLVDVREEVRSTLHQLLVVAIIVNFGWVAVRTVRLISEVISRRLQLAGADTLEARSGHTQLQAFRNVAMFLIVVITAGLALLSFGGVRQVGASLLASAGVAGIVIGFAAQRTIATVLAGITIALAQPIRIRDVVVVEGQLGTIEEITLTYVVVRAWDLRRLVLPINYFIEKPFENWTRSSGRILATVLLHFDYALPVNRLREELKRILDASESWDGTDWRLEVSDATERTLVVRPLMSAANADAAWRLRCEVREKLLGFVQREHPNALPRVRNEMSAGPEEELPGVSRVPVL